MERATDSVRRHWGALVALSLLSLIVSIAVLGATPAFLEAAGTRPATCLPEDCFAEQVRQTGLKQPSNTWSSLSFIVAAGALSWIMLLRGPKRDWVGQLTVSLVVASGLVTAVGSAFYHASLTFLGQTIDVFGMTLFGLTMVLYAATRLLGVGSRQGLYLAFGASLLAATTLFTAVPATRRWLFAALIASGLLLEIQRFRRAATDDRGPWSWLLAALGVFIVGYMFWLLDLAGVAPSPTSPIQGHALWHVAGALSLFLYGCFVRHDLEPSSQTRAVRLRASDRDSRRRV